MARHQKLGVKRKPQGSSTERAILINPGLVLIQILIHVSLSFSHLGYWGYSLSLQVPSPGLMVGQGYRVVSPKNYDAFWKLGRVFQMLWTEPTRPVNRKGTANGGSQISYVWLNETVYSEIRRFVVVSNHYGYCLCLLVYLPASHPNNAYPQKGNPYIRWTSNAQRASPWPWKPCDHPHLIKTTSHTSNWERCRGPPTCTYSSCSWWISAWWKPLGSKISTTLWKGIHSGKGRADPQHRHGP